MYQFLPLPDILGHLDEINREKVSVLARSPGQFLEAYHRYGTDLPQHWLIKRNAFINRTLAAFRQKPSRRRYLSLICWAYEP